MQNASLMVGKSDDIIKVNASTHYVSIKLHKDDKGIILQTQLQSLWLILISGYCLCTKQFQIFSQRVSAGFSSVLPPPRNMDLLKEIALRCIYGIVWFLAMDQHPMQMVFLAFFQERLQIHHNPYQDNVVTHNNNALLSSVPVFLTENVY